MLLRCILVLSIIGIVAGRRKPAPKRTPAPKTTSCGLAILQASAIMKLFSSPGYPGQFSEQTQCSWLIEAPKGFRVKVKLIDFSLVNDCVKQFVVFTDILTLKKIGPICGRRNPEEIISAGNVLRIKLESNSVEDERPYRGFKLMYVQTDEPSSERLRDELGRWRKYMVPTATLAPTRGPTDGNVDMNNNNEINSKNKKVNEINRKLNEARSIANFVPVTETPSTPRQPIQKKLTTVKTTTFPGRWIPPNRIIKKPTLIPNRPARPIYPKRHLPPGKTIESEDENTGNVAAKYIGIICGILVLAAVIFFVAFKWRKKLKEDEQKSVATARSQQITTIAVLPKPPRPPPYRARNYDTIIPTYLEATEAGKPKRPPGPEGIYTERRHTQRAIGTKYENTKRELNKTTKSPDSPTKTLLRDINGNHDKHKANGAYPNSKNSKRSEVVPRRPRQYEEITQTRAARQYEEITETRAKAKHRKEGGRKDIERNERTMEDVKKSRTGRTGEKSAGRARNYEKMRASRPKPRPHRARDAPTQRRRREESKSNSRRRKKSQTHGQRSGKNNSKPRNKSRPIATKRARPFENGNRTKRRPNRRKRADR